MFEYLRAHHFVLSCQRVSLNFRSDSARGPAACGILWELESHAPRPAAYGRMCSSG